MKNKYIQDFFSQIQVIHKHYSELARISGENFNIFNIINVTEDEVKHSALIAELLNPKGSHGQGDVFLKLFLKTLKSSIENICFNNFHTEKAIVQTEKSIGPITDDSGGRIDIFINDNQGNIIIIENKIYAGDQEKQLVRYHKYNEKNLFYLTLFGNDPDPISTKYKDIDLKSGEHFYCISYENHIIQWLIECQKEAVSLPIIRETIFQYIFLLKRLTNQNTTIKMADEIIEILARNLEYIDYIDISMKAINEKINNLNDEFKKLPSFDESDIYNFNNFSIKKKWGEDSDGIFIGYGLCENDKYLDTSILRNKLTEIFKNQNKDLTIGSNYHFFAWYNPEPFKRYVKFASYDKKELIKMYANEQDFKDFINKLIKNDNEIKNSFLKNINNELFSLNHISEK